MDHKNREVAKSKFARHVTLFVAAAALIGSGFETSGPEQQTLITAGLISFGCWLALEIRYLARKDAGDIVCPNAGEEREVEGEER